MRCQRARPLLLLLLHHKLPPSGTSWCPAVCSGGEALWSSLCIPVTPHKPPAPSSAGGVRSSTPHTLVRGAGRPEGEAPRCGCDPAPARIYEMVPPTTVALERWPVAARRTSAHRWRSPTTYASSQAAARGGASVHQPVDAV